MPFVTATTLIGGAISGAVMGSAAGAALDRWPSGSTMRDPRRSHCSSCGVPLLVRDLMPVLSWLVLRGRCRHCSDTIDVRLPLLEATSAVGVALTLRMHGLDGRSVLLSVGVVAVLLATFTDLEGMIVPDRLTLPLGAVALIGMSLPFEGAQVGPAPELLIWALGVPLALYALSRLTQWMVTTRPIGGGDVKLLVGVLALATAVVDGPIAVLVLAVLGAASVATVGLMTGRLQRRDRIPFAPAIAGGYLAVVLVPTVATPVARLIGGTP